MLYKKILTNYRYSLDGKPRYPEDIIGSMIERVDGREFRERTFNELSRARIFTLNPNAAVYIDSFREGLQDHQFNQDGAAKLNEQIVQIDMPEEMIWVEFDHSAIVGARFGRGHEKGSDDAEPEEFGKRGFLVDNTGSDKVRISLFRSFGAGHIIDPHIEIEIPKDENGRLIMEKPATYVLSHMANFYKLTRKTDSMKEALEDDFRSITYDMAIPYVLFALIGSKENGLEMEEESSLTKKEYKQAGKFGRDWVKDALRSHYTVRIGPEAEAHLREQQARRSFEREQTQADRNAPVRHWVSEHERRLKGGKIVLVKGHYRGLEVDPQVPTRVVGPRVTEDSCPSP